MEIGKKCCEIVKNICGADITEEILKFKNKIVFSRILGVLFSFLIKFIDILEKF